jgi:hypothetical protein
MVLDGGEWSASPTGCFIPRERAPCTHLIGGWVSPRGNLDAAEEREVSVPIGVEPQLPGHPAHSLVTTDFQCYL